MMIRCRQTRRLVILLPWLLLAALLGCKGSTGVADPWKGTSKLRIATSIAPLYCFAAHLAEPEGEVLCLLSSHGPHDYQPSSFDAKLIATADIFVVVGHGLEEFLDGMVRSSGNRTMKLVKAGEAVTAPIEASGEPHYHGDQLVVHKGTDPHTWLGVKEAREMAAAIAAALAERDPAHAEAYRQRAKVLDQRLAQLADAGKDLKLPGGLVTFHDSFRYFGRSFGVKIEGTIRGGRGEESSGAALAEQAREFKKKNVRLIGVEPQYPRGVAESLAKELGRDQVRLVELDPIETAPLLPGETHKIDRDWYFKQMDQNLKNLRGGS